MEKELIGSGGTGAAARLALPGTHGSAGANGSARPAGSAGAAVANGTSTSAASSASPQAAVTTAGAARTDHTNTNHTNTDHAHMDHADTDHPYADHANANHPRTNTGSSTPAPAPRANPWWLPGVVGEPPMGEPDWVVFVRAVIADAPAEVVVAGRNYPGLSGFALVVAPFAERAAGRLLTSPSNNAVRAGTAVGLAPVLEDFRSHLVGRLARLAARTLVLELHKA
ncbi:type 2 lantipeptide synthetase LanM, partial [Streptomyces sp. SID2119]|nr:type 2 lantipeptide synthetase LanM [Streptomyces sp. SID2119]